jgi:hypothetical protein
MTANDKVGPPGEPRFDQDERDLPPEIGSDWLRKFNDFLEEKPGGREAWHGLMFGSNVALLMLLASHITADVPCGLKDSRKRLRAFSKDLKARIPKLLHTAELITELNRVLLDRRVELEQFSVLPSQLRAYAQYIAEFAKVASSLSSARLPESSDFEFFFLHAYLKCATGQPQWRGLATLLEAAHAGYGRCEEVDEECLRKKIAGMAAGSHATVCSHLEQKAREYVASGNGGWPSGQELEQIAVAVALELSKNATPEAKSPE